MTWTLPSSAPTPLLRLHKAVGVTTVNDANGRPRVSSWVDSVGGFDFTQSTEANRPYRYRNWTFWHNIEDGILFDYDPTVYQPQNFSFNPKNILASSAAGISINSRSFTLLMVLQAHADRSSLPSSNMIPVTVGTTSSGGAPLQIGNNPTLRNRAQRNYSGSFNSSTLILPITKIPVIITGNASGYTINVGGTKYTTSANAASTITGLTLGAFPDFEGSTGWKGAIHELIAFQTSIHGDDTKQSYLISGAMAAHGIALGELYVVLGDSRAHGCGLDTMAAWPKQIRWPSNAVVYGFTFPGILATGVLANMPEQSDVVVSQLATYSRRTAIVDCGINDLTFTVAQGGLVSNTGAGANWADETIVSLYGVSTYQSIVDAYNRIKAIVDELYSEGYDRVWVTAQHSALNLFVGGSLTKRVNGWLAYNQILRAAVANGDFDAVIPVDTLPELADPSNTTYFFDTLHPTTAGHTAQARMIQQYITPGGGARDRSRSRARATAL